MSYRLLFCVFLVLELSSCGKSANHSEETNTLFISTKASRLPRVISLDSSVVTITKSNGEKSNYSKVYQWGDDIVLDHISPGVNQQVAVVLKGDSSFHYSASKSVSIAEGKNDFHMILNPNFGTLRIDLALGFDNIYNVKKGVLTLTGNGQTWTDSLHSDDFTSYFEIMPLHFAADYQFTLALFDEKNEQVLSAKDSFALAAGGDFYRQLHLEGFGKRVTFSFTLLDPAEANFNATLPDSKTKIPSLKDELIFTEILSNPKTSGDDWEWIELYNQTKDTLNLKGCVLAKATSSSGKTTKFDITTNWVVGPNQFIVVGRDSVSFADYQYSDFTLSNSGQSLLLSCEDNVIDSLKYETDIESSWPIKKGVSMELSLKNWKDRSKDDFWCEAKSEYIINDTFLILATPGKLNVCNK